MQKQRKEQRVKETAHTDTLWKSHILGGVKKQSRLLWGEPGALHSSSLTLGTVSRVVLKFISTYRPLHPPPVSDSDISASF